MNRCKQCGKGIPDYKQFCNRSCSAKYNNVRRTRKPWTEEQRKKVSDKYVIQKNCLGCGKIFETKRHSSDYCIECIPYIKNQELYRKLNLVEGSLKERDKRAFDILYEMYFQKNLGVLGIAKETGIRHVSLLSVFRRHGISRIRTISEGVQESILAGNYGHEELLNPRYKSGFHVSWEGIQFHYRSSYELEYAQRLDSQKTRYRYEKIRVKYFDTEKQKERVAVPDFYLPDTNELVEIKSTWTLDEQNMKDKFKAYRDSGYNPILILNKKRVDF